MRHAIALSWLCTGCVMTTTESGAQFTTDPLLKDAKAWKPLLRAYTAMWKHQIDYYRDELKVKEVRSGGRGGGG